MRFGELVLDEKPLPDAPPGAAAAALLEGLRSLGFDALPWDDDGRTFAARCEFVREARPRRSRRLARFLTGRARAPTWRGSSRSSTGSRAARTSRVCRSARRCARGLRRRSIAQLDELAPTHISLPTGTRTPIDYLDDNAPCASMRMQEVFGLAATPRIGGGAVPVTFKLLSPAHRPLQVTRDLASFWRNAYVEVRKDMRGRYPRHDWPENPLEAEPTRRAKPRPPR